MDLEIFLEPQVKSVKTRLECRSGLFLAIDSDGTVQGLKDQESPSTVMFLIPGTNFTNMISEIYNT